LLRPQRGGSEVNELPAALCHVSVVSSKQEFESKLHVPLV
jgi:hypothetical protein